MAKVKVGFIGAGRIADLHARAYRDNPTGELYAVADSAPGRAELRAAEWDAPRAYEDFHDLLADADVDAVEILLPHHLHRDAALAALEAGKHVSLQKPIGLNLRQADEVIAAAARAGTLFRVFENFLAYGPYRSATSLIESGEIGDPLSIRIHVIGGAGIGRWHVPDEAWEWRFDPERGGGSAAILDHGAHIVASIIHFMGPVEKVHAMADTRDTSTGRWGAPGTFSFKFADGQRYGAWSMTHSRGLRMRTSYYSGDELVEIVGARGILWINRGSADLLGAPPVTLYRDGEMRQFSDMETDWGESFRVGGMEFTAAIASGGRIGLSGAESRRVLAVQLALMKSALEHREVAIAEMG